MGESRVSRPAPPVVRVAADPAALARAAAEEIARRAAEAVRVRGRFTWALSGGSTPRALLELLADPAAPYRARMPWASVHLFWGDERHVPPEHPDSNFGMARAALLDRVPVPAAQVHRIHAELADAGEAARQYEEVVRAAVAAAGATPVLTRAPGEPAATGALPLAEPAPTSGLPLVSGAARDEASLPRFDVILLGLGADGHTASLFPDTPALREETRLVVANPVERLGTERITFTFPLLEAARCVLFLVAGADKAARVAEAVEGGPAGADAIPAARVRPRRGELLWLVDAAAAGRLAGSR